MGRRMHWIAIVIGVAAGLLSLTLVSLVAAYVPVLTRLTNGPGTLLAYPLLAAVVAAGTAAALAKTGKVLHAVLAPVLVYALFWMLANWPW